MSNLNKRRLQALKKNRIKYKAKNPCPHGHYYRYVKSNNCIECSKESVRKNRGKYKQINKGDFNE